MPNPGPKEYAAPWILDQSARHRLQVRSAPAKLATASHLALEDEVISTQPHSVPVLHLPPSCLPRSSASSVFSSVHSFLPPSLGIFLYCLLLVCRIALSFMCLHPRYSLLRNSKSSDFLQGHGPLEPIP